MNARLVSCKCKSRLMLLFEQYLEWIAQEVSYNEWMSAKECFASFRRRLFGSRQQVHYWRHFFIVDSVRVLFARECDLLEFFAQFDARLLVDFHKLQTNASLLLTCFWIRLHTQIDPCSYFENATKSWLLLASYQMGTNTKSVDRVALGIQRMQNVLVDVVACHNRYFLEPRNVVAGWDFLEERTNL